MEKKEYEITSNLFGGYNKKRTDAYIVQLQNMIEESQEESDVLREEKEELTQKLAEAENCYKVLWERSKGQEETMKAQEEALKAREEIIRQQEEMLKNQEERFDRQEQMLDELMKKNSAIPFEKIEKVIRKQFEKARKKKS